MRSTSAEATADLHCHSSASGPNGNWWYVQLGLADCMTPPDEVYGQAKQAGMTFVTLTDHDSIDGALELAQHPDFIIGEEVTVCFADNGARIDVVVLGLDERQHGEIQARRDDAFALVRYLRTQRLVHFLAHPIYDPANALEPEHLARLGALFPLWETRNGARLAEANALAERLHPDLERHRFLAAEHGIEPGAPRPARIGGSDDHGGTDVGTTYTVTPPAASRDEFLDHLRAGRCRAAGLHANPARMTHMVMRLLDRHGGPAEQRRVEAWCELGAGGVTHREVARLAEAFAVSADEDDDEIRLPFADPSGVGRQLTGVRRYLRGQAKLLPYLAVQAYLARERQGARELARRMAVASTRVPLRVALLADGLTSTNGVAETYREILPQLDGSVTVTPIVCGQPDGISGVVVVARAETLAIPIYSDLDLPLPHLSEVAERVFDLDADLVHVTGPGPLGLAGLAIAKLLRLPLVASYHTELGDYARLLTGDPLLAELMHAATARFYGAADVVIAPSQTVAERLPRLLGIDPGRVVVAPQAVDCDRFSPAHRERPPSTRDEVIVLCVARLSREKSIDCLIEAIRRLARPDVRLVIVGDGPARGELERLAGRQATFTGWLRGGALERAFASADVFVLPSATETCGQVLLEAQASGLPCVVSPTGAAREVIMPGQSGLVAANDSAAAIADCLRTLVGDPEQCAAMGRAARANAQTRSWRASAQALADAYRLAADRPPAAQQREPLAALA